VLERTRDRDRAGKRLVSAKSRTPITVRIRSAEPDPLVLVWTAGETALDDPAQAANPLVRGLANVARDLSVELVLDPETAAIRAVRNWPELQLATRKALDQTFEAAGGALPPDQSDAIRRQFERMFASEGAVVHTFARDAQILLLPVGRAYDSARPLEYDAKLPNPIGGEPIPARGSFTVRSQDPATGRLVVDWTQSVDPELTLKILETSFAQLPAGVKEKLPKKPEILRSINIEDRANFVLDTSSGWPIELQYSRISQLEAAASREVVHFKPSVE
jgi:hypothetical protein